MCGRKGGLHCVHLEQRPSPHPMSLVNKQATSILIQKTGHMNKDVSIKQDIILSRISTRASIYVLVCICVYNFVHPDVVYHSVLGADLDMSRQECEKTVLADDCGILSQTARVCNKTSRF